MNKKVFSILCVLVFLFTAVPAFCEGELESYEQGEVITPISTTSTANSTVLVTVNLIHNTTITQADIDEILYQYQQAGGDISTVDTLTLLEKIALQELYNQAYCRAGYVDENYYLTDDTINGILNYFISLLNSNYGISFATEEEFNAFLAEQQWNIEDIVNSYKDEYLQLAYINEYYSDILNDYPEINDEFVLDFYESNKSILVSSEKLNLSHVFFAVPEGATATEKAKIKEKADSVYKQIKNGTITFEKAVSTYSEDKNTKASGGMIGWLCKEESAFEQEILGIDPSTNSQYMKNFFGENNFNALFKLDDGDVSTVMEGLDGYHIFKVLIHQNSEVLALDDPIYPSEATTIEELLVQYLIPEVVYDTLLNNAVVQMQNDLFSEATITY